MISHPKLMSTTHKDAGSHVNVVHIVHQGPDAVNACLSIICLIGFCLVKSQIILCKLLLCQVCYSDAGHECQACCILVNLTGMIDYGFSMITEKY